DSARNDSAGTGTEFTPRLDAPGPAERRTCFGYELAESAIPTPPDCESHRSRRSLCIVVFSSSDARRYPVVGALSVRDVRLAKFDPRANSVESSGSEA